MTERAAMPPISPRCEPRTAVAAESSRRREHHGYSNLCGCESANPPRVFRLSLAQAILREIRSLFSRIRELQRRRLDRRGISLDPLHQIESLEVRERASGCCTEDMHNLYASRLLTTLIEAELFAEGSSAGAAYAIRNCDIGPRV